MGETTDRHRVKSGSPFNYLQHGPNGIIQPLLTDLYQVTMAYGYWKSGRHEDTAVFDLFFRKNPFDGEFTIFGGLEECLKFVEKFHFTDEAIDYLRSVLPEMTEDGFFDFLRNLDGSQLSIHGIPEGSVVFPKEPLIRIEGPLAIAQLLETTFLTLVNYASLVSTNAARFRMASGEKVKLVEFGLRRAQGPDGGLSASKYVYMGGFDGTSNLLAGKLYDIPVYGTHAHSFVSSFGSLNDLPVEKRKLKNLKTGVNVDLHEICTSYRSELLSCLGVASHQPNEGEYTAFMAYAIAFPTGFLALVDTYNTLVSGIPNFLTIVLALNELGYAAKGIRLDSGDLAYLSIRCRKMFKTAAKKI